MTCTIIVGGFFGDEGKKDRGASLTKIDHPSSPEAVSANADMRLSEIKSMVSGWFPRVLSIRKRIMIGGVLVVPGSSCGRSSRRRRGGIFVDERCGVIRSLPGSGE